MVPAWLRRGRSRETNEEPPPPAVQVQGPGPQREEKQKTKMAKFVIRPATAADCSDILRLIKELAKYEYMEEQVMLTEKGNAAVAGRGKGVRYLSSSPRPSLCVLAAPSCRSTRGWFRRAPFLPLPGCRSAQGAPVSGRLQSLASPCTWPFRVHGWAGR